MSLLTKETESFGFLLLPGHPMLPVSAAIDVLALANYVGRKPFYSWCTLGQGDRTVTSMNGLSIQTDQLFDTAPHLSNLVVCAGVDGHEQANPEILAWLRRIKTEGTSIGAVSTGSWVLAQAGLLDGKRCTIHWEDRGAFRETYPHLDVSEAIFETDGPIFTCSGGTAVVDLALTFVAAGHGIDLANKVAEQLLHSEIRSPLGMQTINRSRRLGIANAHVRTAVQIMERNLEDPVQLPKIARQVGLSQRHLDRLFRSHLGRSPKRYYLECRLRLARSLVRQTDLPIYEIALACGFSSSSYLAKWYAQQFGCVPLEERQSFVQTTLKREPTKEH